MQPGRAVSGPGLRVRPPRESLVPPVARRLSGLRFLQGGEGTGRGWGPGGIRRSFDFPP